LGAVQSALAAFDEAAAKPLVDRCERGDPSLRLGLARVYAANVASPEHRARCEPPLRALFNDPDAEVRETAAGCLRELVDFSQCEAFAFAYISSSAFRDERGAEQLLTALDMASFVPSRLAATCGMAILDQERERQNRRIDVLLDSSELAVRACADAKTPDELEFALDLIDRSLALNSYGVTRAIETHDRA
jgi:hypothetical protein